MLLRRLQHPHLTPEDTWKELFDSAETSSDPAESPVAEELKKTDALFKPSQSPGHQEILRLLKENGPDSITVVAIGPLTNLALAAAEDPETFLRLKEVVVMGGNIDEAGNVCPSPISASQTYLGSEPPFRLIKQASSLLRHELNVRNQITPTAEFNTFADSVAAARVYALTSPRPQSTMPPVPPAPRGKPEGSHPPPYLAPYPSDKLTSRLKVTLFPLDITQKHDLTRGDFNAAVDPLLSDGSPLAEWTAAFMDATFEKVASMHPELKGDEISLALHDPLCVWYCMTDKAPRWKIIKDEDIRVETSGQWTRGMSVVDRRNRQRRSDDDEHEIPGDKDNWLSGGSGNRLQRCIASGGEDIFGAHMLQRIFEI